MTRTFAVHPVNYLRALSLPMATLVLVTGGLLVLARIDDLRVLWSLPPILGVVALLLFTVRRCRITLEGSTLDDAVLVIAAGVNTRRTPVSALDLAGARCLDLREHTEFKPLLKLNGGHLPGYSAGHFLLRDRRRAFVLLTRHEQVLMVPEASGHLLLLTPEHPRQLLAALREFAPTQMAR